MRAACRASILVSVLQSSLSSSIHLPMTSVPVRTKWACGPSPIPYSELPSGTITSLLQVSGFPLHAVGHGSRTLNRPPSADANIMPCEYRMGQLLHLDRRNRVLSYRYIMTQKDHLMSCRDHPHIGGSRGPAIHLLLRKSLLRS